jgi:hypothetical protein
VQDSNSRNELLSMALRAANVGQGMANGFASGLLAISKRDIVNR